MIIQVGQIEADVLEAALSIRRRKNIEFDDTTASIITLKMGIANGIAEQIDTEKCPIYLLTVGVRQHWTVYLKKGIYSRI